MTFLSIEENLEIGKYKYAIHSLCLLSETVAVYSFTPSQWNSDPVQRIFLNTENTTFPHFQQPQASPDRLTD